MTKILFIAYYFPPIGGAGVQRSLKFAQHLPSEGFLPVVITGPTPADAQWTPHDSTLATIVPGDVQIHRAKGPLPAVSTKLRGRLQRWLGWPSPFSEWWQQSAVETACANANGCAAIVASMSPFESAAVATEVSRRTGLPWVADLRDPWALDEMQVYPSRLHRRMEMAKMEKLLSSASLIVMNTPAAEAALRAAFPSLGGKRVVTITNGYDREDFQRPVRGRTDDKFRIVHTGYLHTALGRQLNGRGLSAFLGGAERGVNILTRSHVVLLDALEQWCERDPAALRHIEIVFAGKTSREDEAAANRSKLCGAIDFRGYLSHSASVDLVRTADLLFLPMHNLPAGRRARIVPGKTYEYMASGQPILAAVPEGDARDFLTQSGTAFVCRPDDVSGMVAIIGRIYSAWKEQVNLCKPNVTFIEGFERRRLARALADELRNLLAPKAA